MSENFKKFLIKTLLETIKSCGDDQDGLGQAERVARDIPRPHARCSRARQLNSTWDYRTLTYENFPAFFDKTVLAMEPGPTATDNPQSIRSFRDGGGKLLMWHGWADQIMCDRGRAHCP